MLTIKQICWSNLLQIFCWGNFGSNNNNTLDGMPFSRYIATQDHQRFMDRGADNCSGAGNFAADLTPKTWESYWVVIYGYSCWGENFFNVIWSTGWMAINVYAFAAYGKALLWMMVTSGFLFGCYFHRMKLSTCYAPAFCRALGSSSSAETHATKPLWTWKWSIVKHESTINQPVTNHESTL